MDCSPPGSSVHGDSPGRNTGMGCHFLLQGIFPTQGLNLYLLNCLQILYHLNHQGSPWSSLSDCNFLPWLYKPSPTSLASFWPSLRHQLQNWKSEWVSESEWKSLSHVWLFVTHGLYSPWNFPGQNIGVGSLSLLQKIFPTQGSNPGLPHYRREAITSWATREALNWERSMSKLYIVTLLI